MSELAVAPAFIRARGARKLQLAVRIWARLMLVATWLRRTPLPELVRRLGDVPSAGGPRYAPVALGNAVARSLGVGRIRPRCLAQSLVLFRLLREQGEAAELLIGLPAGTRTRAHAWVEVRGVDVGPPPGRMGCEPLGRFS